MLRKNVLAALLAGAVAFSLVPWATDGMANAEADENAASAASATPTTDPDAAVPPRPAAAPQIPAAAPQQSNHVICLAGCVDKSGAAVYVGPTSPEPGRDLHAAASTDAPMIAAASAGSACLAGCYGPPTAQSSGPHGAAHELAAAVEAFHIPSSAEAGGWTTTTRKSGATAGSKHRTKGPADSHWFTSRPQPTPDN